MFRLKSTWKPKEEEINLTKVDVDQLASMSEEELKLLIDVAAMLGIKLISNSKIPGESKIVQATFHCRFCKTSYRQYIKLCKYTDESWRMEKVLNQDELPPYTTLEIVNIKTDSCYLCKELVEKLTRYYLAKSKENLN